MLSSSVHTNAARYLAVCTPMRKSTGCPVQQPVADGTADAAAPSPVALQRDLAQLGERCEAVDL
jgi:hypothetical protein